MDRGGPARAQGRRRGSERGCEVLAELARTSAPGELSSEAHIGARARFVDELHARRGASHGAKARGWRALLQAAIVAFAVCFGGLMLWSTFAERPLTYVVEGENAGSGTYVRAAATDVRVMFSEGSEPRFAPGSSGELADLSADGARIVAHDGTLRAHIRSLPNARWSFDAEPYTVKVTGTEFSLTWRADERRLVVELVAGSLLVRGPEAPSGVALGAGHRLVGREGVARSS